ncbi:MAG: hypothetical protein NUV83_01920 [Candidatus Wolfebacteria bacterium]|nr:hypothetical protein [Candidatus Wolfebacteria bacterium]
MKRLNNFKLKEFDIFEKLDTPSKIQDFIDNIPINFEKNGETCQSPLMVLKNNKAHCLEGALLAAAIFLYHGKKPLLLDLVTTPKDDYHTVALFKEGNRWGAISKTNHAFLRYRDPVYKSARELAMSYFNEYFLDSGKKTLRSYSDSFDLTKFGENWLVAKNNLWNIAEALDNSKHHEIINKKMIKRLRLADPIEIKANKLVQWRKK